MRERAKKVASALGYDGATAGLQDLRKSPTEIIAFVADSLTTSWETGMALEGVQQAVAREGVLVLAAETQNNPTQYPEILSYMLAQQPKALIYCCIHTRKIKIPPALRSAQFPVYLLNCYADDVAYPSVVPSDVAGGHRATQVLIDAGHRLIATVTGERHRQATTDRLSGYRRALAAADIPFDPALVVDGDWSANAGYSCTKQLLDIDRPPTAIFCQNDRMATGCYEALRERSYSIPNDMSVIGYDDVDISRQLFPQLTTLILRHRAMGRWAMEKLF